MSKTAAKDYVGSEVYRLAAFECLSSNIINALILKNIDYRYFILNYWNIEYFKKSLFGAKNINLCFLDYIYGIKLIETSGNIDSILNNIKNNKLIILKSKISNFHYFPEEKIGVSDRGIEHTCLIYNFNNLKKEIYIMDGTLKYKGVSSFEEIKKTKNNNGEFSYIIIDFNPGYKIPSIDNILIKAVDYNYRIYKQDLFKFGRGAFKFFLKDIEEAVNLNKYDKYHWLNFNVISISSILHIHRKIRNILKEFKMFNHESIYIDEYFNKIINDWELIVKLLIDYRDNNLEEMFIINSLITSLKNISEDEEKLLFMIRKHVFTKYNLG